MDRVIFGNALGEWVIALGIAVAVMLTVRVIAHLVVRRLRHFAAKTATDLDDLFVDLLARMKVLFVLMIGLWAGSLRLELSDTAATWVERFLAVGFLIQGAIWVNGTVTHFLDGYRRRLVEVDPGSATAIGALGFLARFFVWITFGLFALLAFEIEITPLLASLGIGGLAVALALQNVLSDLFASLAIVMDKPFVIGDFIDIDDMKGTVEYVGLKTTRLRSLSGEQLVISNSDLLSSRIRNFKRMEERRALFTVGVVYATPTEVLKEIPDLIRGAVESQSNARLDRTHFSSFGDSSLNFETVYFMLVPDYNAYMDTQQEINLQVCTAFRDREIEFAFPTRTLFIEGGAPPER